MRRNILLGIAAVLTLLIVIGVGFSYSASAPLYDEPRGDFAPTIANPDIALTFARARERLLLVTAQDDRSVTGRDLTAALGASRTADLVSLYHEFGFHGLAAIEAPVVTLPIESLGLPATYIAPHLAAGTNFQAHADEVYLDDPPFLFPKLVRATPWNAPVPFTPRLDYEAELCLFPLRDIDSPEQSVEYGLVLCNDFTDRWTLVREIELSKPMGLTGFAAGKGCSDCLPTGYLVVIPREPDFHSALEISLYVNDRLRQRFQMDQMILSVEEIVRQSFTQADVPYQNGDETVRLLPQGRIPAGTLILAGTAAGIAFKPVNIWNQGFYLKGGDVVRVEAPFLGHLANEIGTD